jgi:glucosylglycerate synthase
MAEQTTIAKETLEKIRSLETCDIVAGIPSFNNAATIEHVVRTVQQGLHAQFPQARAVVVHADGGSKDATPELVLAAASDTSPVLQVPYSVHPMQKLATPYSGVPGKANAVRLVFETARMLGAKACAVVDPDLRSIQPDWVGLLVRPVLENDCDLVAPCYQRHKFDGMITNSIVYPMTRALYGKRIRQPIGGEFGFSAALIERYLAEDGWDSDVVRFGFDIWATTQAVCFGFRAGQVFLGGKPHEAAEPAPDLSVTLSQVLGAVFGEMERNARVWQRVRGSQAVQQFGEPRTLEDGPMEVDVAKMIHTFDLAAKNLFDVWGLVIPPAALLEMKRLSGRQNSNFRFPDDLWVQVVYDFAVAYRQRTISRDHLLRALTPVYLGWVGSFLLEMEGAEPARVEARIEELCLRFEAEKPYLISRWRWPDRFNP